MLNHNFFSSGLHRKLFWQSSYLTFSAMDISQKEAVLAVFQREQKLMLVILLPWDTVDEKKKTTLFSWCYHSLPSSLLYYLPLLLFLVIPRFTWILPTWIGLRNSGTILNHNIGKGCNCTNVFSFIHSCHWIWKE